MFTLRTRQKLDVYISRMKLVNAPEHQNLLEASFGSFLAVDMTSARTSARNNQKLCSWKIKDGWRSIIEEKETKLKDEEQQTGSLTHELMPRLTGI